MIVAGNGSIGEGNSALSIDAAALKGTVVSGDRHILDGYPSLRINAAPVAITCIPRGGRLVAGDRGVGDRNIAGVKVDIDAAAVAGGCRVAGDGAAVHGEAALLAYIHAAATAIGRGGGVARNGAAVHGEARRVGLIRRADKEHTAAGAAACFITGNLSTIHGKGRAGLIGAALYTDLHAAGDRAAVQFKFAAVDGHFALNPAAVGAVGQRQRRAAADGDFAVDRLPVQAEVDLAFWHSPAPRHGLRQIIAASSTGQGIGCRPCCAVVMGMTVDRCTAVLAADTVGMLAGLCVRQQRGLAVEPAEQRLEVCACDLRLLLCVQCFISIIRRLNVVISCVQLVGGHAVQLTHDGQRIDHRLHSGYRRVRIVPGVFILAALGRICFTVLSATGVRGTGILRVTL